MAIPSPDQVRGGRGDNCPMLSATARFLIWATRNHRPSAPLPIARDHRQCN